MKATIIICVVSILTYYATILYFVLFKQEKGFTLLMENPLKIVTIARVWYYGSISVLIGCVAFHFINKYW